LSPSISALLAVARLAQSLDGSRLAGSLPVPVTRLTDNVPGLRWQGGQMYKFNPPFRLKTGRRKNPFPCGQARSATVCAGGAWPTAVL